MIKRPLLVIVITIALDAVGLGLIFPILPRLLEDVAQTQNIVPYLGLMTALYAAMQFFFSPALGVLSDHFGRRPVLLVSLAGAAIDYLVLAFAPQLWMLLLSRAIAGLTSANYAVATAYIVDISSEDERVHRFSLCNAAFGMGFVAGPIVGGVLGDHWVRLPFIAAAIMNGCNFFLTFFMLPESYTPSPSKFNRMTLNPLRPLRWVYSINSLIPVVLIYVVLTAAGESYGVGWALWTSDTFRWNGLWIGLSLGVLCIFQAFFQILLPGRVTKLMGERGTILLGILINCFALIALSFANRGWMVFLALPFIALGSIGAPALQSLAVRQVGSHQQGQLQGVLASSTSLASIIAPLAFSAMYSFMRDTWPGAIWLAVALTLTLAVPLIFLGTRTTLDLD